MSASDTECVLGLGREVQARVSLTPAVRSPVEGVPPPLCSSCLKEHDSGSCWLLGSGFGRSAE